MFAETLIAIHLIVIIIIILASCVRRVCCEYIDRYQNDNIWNEFVILNSSFDLRLFAWIAAVNANLGDAESSPFPPVPSNLHEKSFSKSGFKQFQIFRSSRILFLREIFHRYWIGSSIIPRNLLCYLRSIQIIGWRIPKRSLGSLAYRHWVAVANTTFWDA